MRLALFDLDNTLVDRDDVIRGVTDHVIEHHGLDPAETAAAMLAADLQPWPERMATLRARFGLRASVDELLAEHRGRFLDLYRPAAATLAALADLRAQGWRIGIVTNGTPFQEDKLRASGLPPVVDGYVVSDVLGARKPSPAIFAAAARLCGCGGGDGWAAGLDAGWMVGDSAPADIAGARAAGLRSAWLHRGRPWEDEPTGLTPDHIVDDVAAAVALMLQESD